jgi:alpha-mannosidase II
MIRIYTGTEYDAYFSKTSGFLVKYASESETVLSSIRLIKYQTNEGGAYLFLPAGPAKDVDADSKSWIRVEYGKLRSRVCVKMLLVMHCVEIFPTVNKLKGLKIPLVSVWNVVDLTKTYNYELAMLVQTSITNDAIVHTDLNGFQYIKRKRHEKLTLQGNVFPMPSGAFIQDSTLRFTILNSQAAGVASLADSQIQVFLDRRMNQDDGLGMSQSMDDNVVVSSRLLLFFEQVNSEKSVKLESVQSDFPSLLSIWLSNDLLYPIVKLNGDKQSILKSKKFSIKNYPCDMHLVNLRTMQRDVSEEPSSNEVGMILHRINYDDCVSGSFIRMPDYINSYCTSQDSRNYSFQDFFYFLGKERSENLVVKNTLLTLAKNHSYTLMSKLDSFISRVQPMQIEAFRVNF